MAAFTMILTALLIATCLPSVHTYGSCTQSNVDRCEAHFSAEEDAIYQSYNRQELTVKCSEYRQFETCITAFKSDCSSDTKDTLNGLEKAFDYICNEGFETRVSNEDCFANKDVHDAAYFCLQTYNTALAQATSNAEICRLFAVLLECLYANFITYCNREVADMQDKVERLLTEDGLKSIGCTINEDESDNGQGGSNNQVRSNAPETVIIIIVMLGNLLCVIVKF